MNSHSNLTKKNLPLAQVSSAGKNNRSISKSEIKNDAVLDRGSYIVPPLSAYLTSGQTASKKLFNWPNDNALTIMKRMTALEEQVEKYKRRLKNTLYVIKNKDEELVKLKEKLKLVEEARKCKTPNYVTTEDMMTLLETVKHLQVRVSALEDILNNDDFGSKDEQEDYYVGIGNGYDDETDGEINCYVDDNNPNFDFICHQIGELNHQAGEIQIYHKTETGGTFRGCHGLSLAMYSDGLLLEGCPFREYCEKTAQLFLKDITDGYYPTELQSEYPRGVILNVCDKRNELYNISDDYNHTIFKGKGFRMDLKTDDENDEQCKNKKHGVSKKKNKRCNETKFESERKKDGSTSSHSNSVCSEDDKIISVSPDTKNSTCTDIFRSHRKKGRNSSMYRNGINRNDLDICEDEICTRKMTIKNGEVCTSSKESESKNMETACVKYLNPDVRKTDSSLQLKIRSFDSKCIFIITAHCNEPIEKIRSYLPEELKQCKIIYYKDSCTRVVLKDNNSTLKNYGILKNSVLILSKFLQRKNRMLFDDHKNSIIPHL